MFDEVIEQLEYRKEVHCLDAMSRSLAVNGKGKALAGTSTYLWEYLGWENEKGRSVSAVECAHDLGSRPSSDGDSDTFRVPVQVFHLIVCTRPHNLRYKRGKEGFAPAAARKARVQEYLIDRAKEYAKKREEDAAGGQGQELMSGEPRQDKAMALCKSDEIQLSEGEGARDHRLPHYLR